jgi:hypothetical protein
MILHSKRVEYLIENHIIDAKYWYETQEKVIESSRDKVLINYFTGDYKKFVNKRKSEIILEKTIIAKVKKYFLNVEDLCFSKESYERSGFITLLSESYPILQNDLKIKDKDKINKDYELFCMKQSFITEETFNIIKEVWKKYTDYLIEVSKKSPKILLKNKVKNF